MILQVSFMLLCPLRQYLVLIENKDVLVCLFYLWRFAWWYSSIHLLEYGEVIDCFVRISQDVAVKWVDCSRRFILRKIFACVHIVNPEIIHGLRYLWFLQIPLALGSNCYCVFLIRFDKGWLHFFELYFDDIHFFFKVPWLSRLTQSVDVAFILFWNALLWTCARVVIETVVYSFR